MPNFSNIREYINELKARKQRFLEERTNTRLRILVDLKALMALRIQTTGKNYEDEDFAAYEDSYQAVKELEFENARNGIVDFTVTGNLWRNIKPVLESEDENEIVFVLRADNDTDEAKLTSFIEKWGNILRPSAEELDIVRQANLELYNKLLGL